MDDYEREIYGKGISRDGVLEILKDYNRFTASLDARCNHIVDTCMELMNNPIVKLVRNNGAPADEEYFRILSAQEYMLGDLKNELHALQQRYMMQRRVILALHLLPEDFRQCIQGVYIDGKKWEIVQAEMDISASSLSRKIKHGLKLIVNIYNLDKSNDELSRSYLDTHKLYHPRKKPVQSSGDGHQVTISELFE